MATTTIPSQATTTVISDDHDVKNIQPGHESRVARFPPAFLKKSSSFFKRKPTSRKYASSSSACTDGTSFRQVPTTRHRSSTTMSPTTFVKRMSFITNTRLVDTLKRDSGIRRRFESFAANQYASESVGFLKSVLEWKAESPGDLEYARGICETYIFEGSPLQVNISWKARTNIEEALQRAQRQGMNYISENSFDDAANELASNMVEGGLWGSFVWKGGCDLAEDEDDSGAASGGARPPPPQSPKPSLKNQQVCIL
jgi:hypothetical protein